MAQSPAHSPSAMQIGEVSQLTTLTVDAIRFYERHALLPKAPRTTGRFRLYTHDDVARLAFIKQMQDLGFSLREIKQLQDVREHRRDDCHKVRDLLKMKLATVRSKIQKLEELERELALDLVKCNRELRHRRKHTSRNCPILSSSNDMNSEVRCG